MSEESPLRVAYALDDEISWGVFVVPLPWRLNDDDAAYARWLQTYYGGRAPQPAVRHARFHPAATRAGRWPRLDFSPLLDRLTYNDSVWANFLGELVAHANRLDPATPCGFVGGQSPNIWGGYDYAKLMKKIQFIEAYNLGSAQAIIRSFSPHNALPQVTTHFHSHERGTANDIWQSWYYFAHGNRGMIGWVEGWFDGEAAAAVAGGVPADAQGTGRRAGPEAGRRTLAARRRGDLLLAPVDPGLVVPGHRAAPQDVGQSRQRPPPGHVAQRPQGLGAPADRRRPAIQLPGSYDRVVTRGRAGGIPGADPAGLLCAVRHRGPSGSRTSAAAAAR